MDFNQPSINRRVLDAKNLQLLFQAKTSRGLCARYHHGVETLRTTLEHRKRKYQEVVSQIRATKQPSKKETLPTLADIRELLKKAAMSKAGILSADRRLSAIQKKHQLLLTQVITVKEKQKRISEIIRDQKEIDSQKKEDVEQEQILDIFISGAQRSSSSVPNTAEDNATATRELSEFRQSATYSSIETAVNAEQHNITAQNQPEPDGNGEGYVPNHFLNWEMALQKALANNSQRISIVDSWQRDGQEGVTLAYSLSNGVTIGLQVEKDNFGSIKVVINPFQDDSLPSSQLTKCPAASDIHRTLVEAGFKVKSVSINSASQVNSFRDP